MAISSEKEALRRQQEAQDNGSQPAPTQPASQGDSGSIMSEKERLRRQETQASSDQDAMSMISALDPGADAAPTYGEAHDRLSFSQPGFDAGINIGDDGRLNINIDSHGASRLADILRPAIDQQIQLEAEPDLPPAYIPQCLGGKPGQVPPPRLNVVIQIVGSRGDVQPFVALGKVLKDTYGHRVRIATHPTFQKFVEENDLEFFSIGGDPAELMAFMVKHPGLMPGFDAVKSGEVGKRRKGIAEMLVGCWRSCIEAGNGLGPAPKRSARDAPFNPHEGPLGDPSSTPFTADAIIANPPSFAHIHIAEKLGIPLHMMFTMPWSPTKAFPHPLANIQSSNADDVMTNYLSYTLVEMMTWQGLADVINRFRENVLDISPLSPIWAPGILTRLRIPYTYCWSPALIPKPNDWGNHVDIAGFYFLNLASSYTPDPELADFLDNGPPPIYIGFGSIVMEDPDAMTKLIFDAVKSTGVRALVSKGWGGLGADELSIPDNVFMLGNVPHDWLFQKVSAVCHHGGAGTTAAGIQAGRPSIVIPSFGDQPFWGAMISRAGAGPDPIPAKQLTAEKLAAAINFCMQQDTQDKAKELGQKISQEQGCDVGGQSFHSQLDIEKLRCTLAPSRAAAWQVKKTKVTLSALAAAVLVDRGLLQYNDIKLYRPREYLTEDQPPDPISAAATSLVMDLSGIGLGVFDMPRNIFKTVRTTSEEVVGNCKTRREASRYASNLQSQKTTPGHSETDLALKSPADGEKEKSSEGLGGSGSGSGEPTPGTATPTSSAPTTSAAPPDKPVSPAPPNKQTSFETMLDTGKGVGHLVGVGARTPMNFCLGVAKGFRNMPRLYHDDTVRPVEKITGIRSGIRVAGKEFGYGVFDGITGLVTQPYKGAEKEGVAGLIKGFGKGIGGVVTKPAAGAWGIPAYAMQGVNAQVNKLFARSSHNYIISSRMAQGENDMRNANPEEMQDIVTRYQALPEKDFSAFHIMKKEERSAGKARAGDAPDSPSRASTSSSGFWHQRQQSMESWRKKMSSNNDSSSERSRTSEDAEYEQAIQESVKQTSRGNAEEDAQIEEAIRQSVMAMRQQGQGLPMPGNSASPSEQANPTLPAASVPERDVNIFKDKEYEITDEEYQKLVVQAIQNSVGQSIGPQSPAQKGESHGDDAVAEKRAIEKSLQSHAAQTQGSTDEGDDEEMRRAIEASMQDDKQRNTERSEEDVVMEYVKKQSLAEEEYRKKHAAAGRSADTEVEDEDLKKAMEESLNVGNSGGGGPSGS